MPSVMLPYPISVNRAYRNFRGNMVKSKEARDYQSKVRSILAQEGVSEPRSGPIRVRLLYRPVLTKSWRVKGVREIDLLLKIRRYDSDNLVKSLFDALNGVVWIDDKQVICLTVVVGTPIENGGVLVTWREL